MPENIMLILGLLVGVVAVVVVIIVVLKRRPKPVSISESAPPPPVSEPGGPVNGDMPINTSGTLADVITPDPDAPKLVAQNGALAQKEFMIPPPPHGLTIGRDPANDVIITDDMMVSRQHAQIMQEGMAWLLHDRDSVNGVFVNGQRIIQHTLHHSDTIQICNTLFNFINGQDDSGPRISPPTYEDSTMTNSMQLGNQAQFGAYMIEKVIGKGGMSVVYKAWNAQKQPVAIKVLDVTGEYIVRKFIQEGRIGVTLREHPNICQTLGADRSQDNRLYIVMEFVAGTSLREMMNNTALSPQNIVHIIGQLCDALHYAHQHHIVHRDVKPENIMVTPQGIVKVTDFGIAKLTSSVTITTDRLVGTPEYVSPEQIQAQRITPASDIYSTGVLLYELLTGSPPFPSDANLGFRQATTKVLSAHIHTPPTPPSQIRAGIPPHFEAATLKALAKSPSHRFASVLEMAQTLGYQSQSTIANCQPQLNAKIAVINGTNQGHQITIGKTSMVLGRNHIAPDDFQISGQHVVVAMRGNQLCIQDISRNGTWVNGQRVYGEIALTTGDVIQVGQQVLQLEINNLGQ